LLEELLENYPYFDPQHVTSKLNNQKLSHVQWQQKMQPIPKPFKHKFHPHISMMKLNDEQQRVFDSITKNPHGLHILASTPKSGKTFFVKYITHHFHMHGKNVLLLVTTCVATLFLSAFVITMHTAFCIPTCGYLLVFPEPHNVKKKLKSTNVIIIDEMLMMTNNMLCIVEQCLKQAKRVENTFQSFQNKLILLVGDLAQLLAICKHTLQNNDILCKPYHIKSTPSWKITQHHILFISMRHATDLEYL
jgi:hypothetical protein